MQSYRNTENSSGLQWESFLLSVLAVCLFFRHILDRVGASVGDAFFSSLEGVRPGVLHETVTQDSLDEELHNLAHSSSNSSSSGLESVISPSLSSETDHAVSEPMLQRGLEHSSILPPLPDIIVIKVLWPKLNDPPSISLLYRLRRVNKTWMRLISGTVEWSALEFVKLDNTGYLQSIRRFGKPRLSRNTRLRAEIHCFRRLLHENLILYERNNRKKVIQEEVETYDYSLIHEAGEAATIRLPD